MTHVEPVPPRSWFQRWGQGVAGPAAVLLWAATQQSWGWVAFAGIALALGVARNFVGPGKQAGLTQMTTWVIAAGSLGFAALAWYLTALLLMNDRSPGAWFIAILVLLTGVAMATLGVLLIWPRQTMRLLHIQDPPGAGFYRDPERPAGPNDVLPS